MTPLQMAMVAAAVANGGVVMKPHVVERIVAPGRHGRSGARSRTSSAARSARSTAAELTEMMKPPSSSGTGTAAQIPGVAVAGKTGTAETGVSGRNTVWFIGFAPADEPKVAVAVVVEAQSGTGGADRRPDRKERSCRHFCRDGRIPNLDHL